MLHDMFLPPRHGERPTDTGSTTPPARNTPKPSPLAGFDNLPGRAAARGHLRKQPHSFWIRLLEYCMTCLQRDHVSVYIWVLHNRALARKIITGISVIFFFSSALHEIISKTE